MVAHIVQRFLKLKVLFLVIALPLVLGNCGKSGNVKWVYYDETNCADKWERSANNEKLKQNVTDFLESKGIKVFEIEIFSDRTPDKCSDCNCRSGRRIKCKIKKGEVKEAKGLGFYD